jgi:hypothetical protein
MFIETALGMTTGVGAAFPNDPLGAANDLLGNYRPTQIADFLEDYWRQGVGGGPGFQLGVPVGDLANHQEMARGAVIDLPGPNGPPVPAAVPLAGWHHLVYAYMIENTRILDIFRRVVSEYLHGERLPHATHATVRWIRTTEELFFSTPRSLTVRSITSNLRPDDGSVRRNLYWRALGMDLNHGMEDGRPYPFTKADASNKEFVTLWETLMSEVWKGFTAANPLFSGIDETDDAAIATLVRRLQEMLLARRLNGLLSREEFDAVACMSWFRLVISMDTQVVVNLNAQAAGEADRLKQIGTMVGLPAHSRTDAYLQIAQPMSLVLRAIENGAASALPVGGLYDPAIANNLSFEMRDIITNWSIATGRNMKDPMRRQSTLPVLTESIRSQPASSGNGQLPVSRTPVGMLR